MNKLPAGKLLFQFLLGRLETAGSGIKMGRTKGFQFLLGRLETCLPLDLNASRLRFNSS